MALLHIKPGQMVSYWSAAQRRANLLQANHVEDPAQEVHL